MKHMMFETIRKPLDPDWWIANGGDATLLSYGHPRTGNYQPDVVPANHMAWLETLPLCMSMNSASLCTPA
jgi:serine/threonine protein phosphatase 1